MSKPTRVRISLSHSNENEPILYYIGKTKDHILKNCSGAVTLNELVDYSAIEIRLTDATLTCLFQDNICIDARLFKDHDQESTSFHTRYLFSKN